MKYLTHLALLLAALLLPAIAHAYDFEVDGIYYNIINGNEAEVTYQHNGFYDELGYEPTYSGNVTIPTTVTYNGMTYSVTSIGEGAFWGCSELTSVTIPNSVTSIGEDAFCVCSSLTSVIIPNSVTAIGGSAFWDCSGLTNIIIPNSVATIGDAAFGECRGLVSVTIPNSVTAIGECAFHECSSLTSVTIPNSVTVIERGVFSGCRALTSVTIPNSVTIIGGDAFASCYNLASVDIPNSVISIKNGAFVECHSLTDITIPNSVVEIGSAAFEDTPWYDNQPDGLVYAGLVAYSYKGTMPDGTNLSLKEGTVAISSQAFAGCSGLTSITIPSSVIFIGHWAYRVNEIIYFNDDDLDYSPFFGCISLNSVHITDLESWCNIELLHISSNPLFFAHHLFLNDEEITHMVIPNSVTSINRGVFAGCSGLTSVTIPNSVTTIGETAFYGCSEMTSATIPNSVTTIDNSAFFGCDRLKDVYSFIEDPTCISMGGEVFYLSNHDYSQRTLHVPLGTLDDYQSDARWNRYFDSIVEMTAPVSSIEIDKKAATVIEGETLQLAAIILPEDAANKAVTWASSNPNVATVDENGLVTAVGLGTATITAMTTDGSNLSASCQVTVTSESTTCGFVIRNAEVLHGESIVIPVAMVNDQPIFAFQTDVYLPEGFSLATNPAMEPVVTPLERLTSDHEIMASDYNGAVRIICYTPNAMPIEGNEGDLFYITVLVPNNAEGDYAIYLRNTRLTTTDYTELRAPDAGAVLTVKTFIPGDANDSHSVNVADIVTTALYVIGQNPSPFVFDAADMNGDGEITVTDIMLIAHRILYPEGMNAPRQAPAIGSNKDRMSGEVITTGATRKVSILLDNETDYSAFQLDLTLPEGLTSSNFELTDRAGGHTLDVNTLANGKTRVLCYTPAIQAIDGHEGAVLTFDVTANSTVLGDITVDGIELVTTACEMVRLGAFTIGVNNITAVNEVAAGKTVARVDYFNVAGQRLAQPERGVTLVVTTYTDGTRTTAKLHR